MIDHDQKNSKKRDLAPMKTYPLMGWREWVSFPELGIDKIKAKIDTGARTSALHAFSIKVSESNGRMRIQFDIHPLQHNTNQIITCSADVIDKRLVTDSGGHTEERYVIATPIMIATFIWTIEVTLTERENMLFRMLLGRNAIKKRFVINPARSFLISGKAIKNENSDLIQKL